MTTPRRLRWRAVVRGALAERLGLKAAALFFALVLWVVTSAEEPTEQVVTVRFAPVIDSGMTIVGELPQVRALVLGSGRELLKLYEAAPVIVRRLPAEGSETVNLELGPADVDLPAGVAAVVRDVRPHFVTLRLRRVTSTTDAGTDGVTAATAGAPR